MKISIITTVYNSKNTIAQAMKSIQSQSYHNIEHIIQDGGSTDGTLDIIKELSNSKTQLESAKDQGIYDAINKGIARSNGDIIGLLHSDDLFADKDVLCKIIKAFKDSKIHATYGDLEYFSHKDPKKIIRKWTAGTFSKNKLYHGWMPPHPTLYVRRECYKHIGGFDTRYRIAADYFSILQLFSQPNFKAVYLPEVMIKMRLGGASNRSLGAILRKSIEDWDALRRSGFGVFCASRALLLKNLSKVNQFFHITS